MLCLIIIGTEGFLAADDVERLIASCPADDHGLRDKAVLRLLARLGLRAGEVAGLRFDDIDWVEGLLIVSGKSRRREKLPLPQEVGDALLRYLRQSRPPLRTSEVFTTVLAPTRPLTSVAVTHIVCAALRRTGVKATRDIRKVALWLGHADVRTTETYLRLDPSEKLEAVEAVLPPALRRGQFKAPDALIASLFEPAASTQVTGTLS